MDHFMFRLSENLGACRYQDRDIRAVFSVTLGTLAMASSLSLKDSLVLEMEKRVDPIGALDIDAPSVAAIPAARAALGNKLFPPEGHTAVPPVTRNYVNLGKVYQHTGPASWKRKKKGPASGSSNLPDSGRFSGIGLNMDKFPETAAILELNDARYLGKKGIVASDPHIPPGFVSCSPLPDNNSPARHQLPGETLDAKPLGLAVSSIAGTPNSFFVCHAETS
jgi:hypothetical protein